MYAMTSDCCAMDQEHCPAQGVRSGDIGERVAR